MRAKPKKKKAKSNLNSFAWTFFSVTMLIGVITQLG